jgi:hypothetical protein
MLRLLAEGLLLLALQHDWRWHVRALASLLGSALAILPLLYLGLIS